MNTFGPRRVNDEKFGYGISYHSNGMINYEGKSIGNNYCDQNGKLYNSDHSKIMEGEFNIDTFRGKKYENGVKCYEGEMILKNHRWHYHSHGSTFDENGLIIYGTWHENQLFKVSKFGKYPKLKNNLLVQTETLFYKGSVKIKNNLVDNKFCYRDKNLGIE